MLLCLSVSDELYSELMDFAERDDAGIAKLKDHIRSFIAGRDSLRDEINNEVGGSKLG